MYNNEHVNNICWSSTHSLFLLTGCLVMMEIAEPLWKHSYYGADMLYTKRAQGQHLSWFNARLSGEVVFINIAVLRLVIYHTFLCISSNITLYFVFISTTYLQRQKYFFIRVNGFKIPTYPKGFSSTEVPQPVHVNFGKNTDQSAFVSGNKKTMIIFSHLICKTCTDSMLTSPCKPCWLRSMWPCAQCWGSNSGARERSSLEGRSEPSPSDTEVTTISKWTFSFYQWRKEASGCFYYTLRGKSPDQWGPRVSRRHHCSERADWCSGWNARVPSVLARRAWWRSYWP